MKSIWYYGKGNLKLIDIPEPKIERPDQIKIRIAYSGICGSDMHILTGELDWPGVEDYGMPMGHEASGVIVEMGSEATAKGLKVGDRVVYEPNTYCGKCYYCRNGKENFCENMKYNVTAMSEYIIADEAAVFKIPDNITLKKGALVEPVAVCMHGIDLARIRPGNSVAISGAGTMGLILIQLAVHAGGVVTVIEPKAERRELAARMGASYVIDPVNQDRKEETMKITNNHGFDVIIEASCSWRACDGLDELVCRGGTLEFIGAMYRADYNFPLNLRKAFSSEITVIGGVQISPYLFQRSAALIPSLNLDPILEQDCVFTPEQVHEAFEAQKSAKVVKTLFRFAKDAE